MMLSGAGEVPSVHHGRVPVASASRATDWTTVPALAVGTFLRHEHMLHLDGAAPLAELPGPVLEHEAVVHLAEPDGPMRLVRWHRTLCGRGGHHHQVRHGAGQTD